MLFFHEDDYCQIEFIPSENQFWLKKYINDLPDPKSTNNGLESSLFRYTMPYPTRRRRIPVNDLSSTLSQFSIDHFNEVHTGTYSDTTLAENVQCFGFERMGICLELDPSHYILNIWLIKDPAFKEESSGSRQLQSALTLIGSQYDFILVDWNIKECFLLSDPKNLDSYINTVLL